MKNVTITLKEDVAQWARVRAAHQNTSVSKLVGDMLRKLMIEERGYRSALRQYLSRGATRLKEGGGYPRREEIHDRKSVR